jgi:hypothetical protein
MKTGIDELAEERDDLLNALCDVINQACGRQGDKQDDTWLDSGGGSAYADAIRLLKRLGRVKVVIDKGRIVTAKWIKEE